MFLSRIVRSEMECSLTCLRSEKCESFNYQDHIFDAGHICELNDQTRLTRSHDLLPRNGFSYYGSGLVSTNFHRQRDILPSFTLLSRFSRKLQFMLSNQNKVIVLRHSLVIASFSIKFSAMRKQPIFVGN